MKSKPLCIDIFAGLGGWTDGFLAEGWECIGFDIERHVYGEHHYPAQLVLQDVCTLHGSQFKDADMIVASSPCQEFSYRAMPWSRAKALGPPELGMHLFAQAARIQREACAAAGRHIPMIQENVRGAQPWVGRSKWNYGSYHLWGDVPVLMPIAERRGVMKAGVAHRANGETNFHASAARARGDDGVKVGGLDWNKRIPGQAFNTVLRTREIAADGVKVGGGPGYDAFKGGFQASAVRRLLAARCDKHYDDTKKMQCSPGTKNTGGSWFDVAHNTTSGTNNNARDALAADGVKQHGSGREWFAGDGKISRLTSSRSSARKAATARISKIPFPLAQYIARVFYPASAAERAG